MGSIADTDLMVIGVYFLMFAIFFSLSLKIRSYFAILAAIVLYVLADEIEVITGSVTAAFFIAILATFVLLMGVFGTINERDGSPRR